MYWDIVVKLVKHHK